MTKRRLQPKLAEAAKTVNKGSLGVSRHEDPTNFDRYQGTAVGCLLLDTIFAVNRQLRFMFRLRFGTNTLGNPAWVLQWKASRPIEVAARRMDVAQV